MFGPNKISEKLISYSVMDRPFKTVSSSTPAQITL